MITSMFITEDIKVSGAINTSTTEFLNEQLDQAKQKLDEQDAKLAAFQRRNVGSLPEDSQTNLNLLNGQTSQLEAATQAVNRAQQDKSFAESILSQQLSAWQATQSGTESGITRPAAGGHAGAIWSRCNPSTPATIRT